jgi:acyl carrier protein
MSCNGCTLKQVHQTKEVRVATIATEITADPSQDCRLYLSACIASLTGEADPAYDKSFLELGLSSAAILRLMTHLEKDLGVTLEATDLFEYPNIETLADYLSDLRVKSPDRKPSTETKSIDNVITTLEKLVAGSINAAEAEQLIDAEDRL